MVTKLSEQHRAKLDDIVRQMQQNRESDDYIQSVVDDFKQKYSAPVVDTETPAPGKTAADIADTFMGGGQLARGVSLGLGSLFSKDIKGAAASRQAAIDQANRIIQHAMRFPPGDPRRTSELEMAQRLAQESSVGSQQTIQDLPTNKQVLGSAGRLALTAAATKLPSGKGLYRTQNLGTKLAPIPVQGLTKQVALSKVPQAIGLGFLSGATQKYGSLPDDNLGVNAQQAKDILKTGGATALTSGVTSNVLGLGGKLYSALTESAPERLANSALGVTRSEQKAYKKAKLPSLGQRALDLNIPAGSPEDIATWATEQQIPLRQQLNDFITQKQAQGKTVTGKELKSYLSDLMKAAKNTPGEEGAYQAFRDMAKSIKDEYTLPQLQILKENLQSAARKSYGKPLGGNIADAQKALAYGARQKLEQTTAGLPVPQSVFDQLTPAEQQSVLAGNLSPINRINKNLQTFGQIQDAIERKGAAEMVRQPVGYRDILGATLGAATGHPFAAADVILGGHLSRSARGQLTAAKVLQALGKPVQTSVAQGLSKAGRIGLIQALGRLLNQ